MNLHELKSKVDLENIRPLTKLGGESNGEGQDQTDRSNGSFWAALWDFFGL